MISDFRFVTSQEDKPIDDDREGVWLICKVCMARKASADKHTIHVLDGELVPLFTRVSLHQHVGSESIKISRREDPHGNVHNSISGDIASGSITLQAGHVHGHLDI